jgi:hypothetical protein
VGHGVDRNETADGSGAAVTPVQVNVVTAKGDLIAGTANAAVDNLAVGTNEHRLVAASAEATGLKYVADTTNYAVAAKGDLLAGTAADTVAALTVGANNKVLTAASGEATGLKWAEIPLPRMWISGLVQSQATDTDHDTAISAGSARDSTDAANLVLSSSITKRIDAAWAVGTDQGGLDGSESVAGTPDASTWYYIWLILRSDTGVVDVLYSESATAPTMPANYDYKRLIGAVLTDSSANITAHDSYEISGGGLEVRWQTPPRDVNLAATLTTAARTDTLSVPTSFSVFANLNISFNDAAAPNECYVSCPDQADQAPAAADTPGMTVRCSVAGQTASANHRLRTSATGTIRSRSSVATADNFAVITYGFEWARRNS